jgi:TIR domain/AAA domain/Tetratricopeptide repeat
MSLPPSRSIYIAHTQSDEAAARQFRETLEIGLGGDVSVSKFNLDSGTSFYQAIGDAITEANWFFLLLTVSSINCEWVKAELDLAAIHAIENSGFKFVVVKLDSVQLPKNLEIPLKTRTLVDLSDIKDWETEFLNIAQYIDTHEIESSVSDVYVGRGFDEDQFLLRARKNKIIFLLGWLGIGKTTFVKQSVAKKLKKRPLVIKLTRGHSTDYLARQIAEKAKVPQLIGSGITDQMLIQTAIEALKKRAASYFLFIDNAENALDSSNSLLLYLDSFIERFINADINTHIVISTTRVAHYSAHISLSASVLRLKQLDDDYIEQSIECWLKSNGQQEQFDRLVNTTQMSELVNLIGGYPLAAKLAAEVLSISMYSVEQLLETSRQRSKFQLKFAEAILRSIELTSLQELILQVLTTVNEPMSLEDIASISEVGKYPLEDVTDAKLDLLNLFLIEQEGEMLSVHNFIKAYYRDQLRRDQDIQNLISREYAQYAYNKSTSLSQELENTSEVFNEIQVSSDAFRYAVSAGKLLRQIGEDDLAKQLAIQIKGTIREMVYHFYQDKNEKDYKKALVYAEAWIKIDPNDLDVKLYQARCHRNIGLPNNLEQAKKILLDIGKRDYNKQFQEKLYREKALISEKQGNEVEAKSFFKKGIEIHVSYSYPGNHIGLAQLLLREADELPSDFDGEQQLKANEALALLEVARKESDKFDRFHLPIYVQALIQAGQEEKALPLLEDALKDEPNDDRLNYRMGEIKRKSGKYSDAIKYAQKAREFGYQKATLTIVNSIYDQAHSLDEYEFRQSLQEALNEIETFRPEFGHDGEVADSIKSKIYRGLGNYSEAEKLMTKYAGTKNLYTLYEICQVILQKVRNSVSSNEYVDALIFCKQGIEKIDEFRNKGCKDSNQINEIYYELEKERLSVEFFIADQ